MVEHATTCPIAQGTGTDCRCRGVPDAHEAYAAAGCVLTDVYNVDSAPAAMTDKERLDWFDANRPFVHHMHSLGFHFSVSYRGSWDTYEGRTIREAIDAAIAASPPRRAPGGGV